MGSASSVQTSREPALKESIISSEQRMASMEVPLLAALRLQAPPASPPTKSKSEICSSSQLDLLDNAVAQQVTSELVRLSTHALASRLVSLADGKDDVARLRLLFTWLASIDIDELVNEAENGNETAPKFSVLGYLHKIQRRQGNYAHMMAALCNCAGIPVRIVSGVVKSASYRLGKPIDRSSSTAQWNAVHVAGEWRLLDSRWASRVRVPGSGAGASGDDWQLMYVDGRRVRPAVTAAAVAADASTQQRIRRPINDFFFLPEPAELAATHFPDDPAWQLVAEPLAWIDFERGAYVRERFFQLGARFGRSELARNCTVPLGREATTAVVELIIDAAESPSITFKYVLSRARADQAAKAAAGGGDGGSDIRRCVYFEQDGRTIRYTVQLPARAEYKFDLYGRDARVHDSHDLMCSYLLTNEHVDSAELPPQQLLPLPDDPEIGWGPGASCDAYGIVAVSHRAGRIDIPDASSGELDVVFALPQHPLELRHVLLTGGDGDEGSRTVTAAAQSILIVHGGQATVSLRIVQPGAYALKLFAGEERVPAELQNVCNYLITRRSPPRSPATAIVAAGFPLLVDGHLGLTSYSRELCIEPSLPERHPIVVLADGDDNSVDLEFVCSGPPLELLALASGMLRAAATPAGSRRGRFAAGPSRSGRGVVLHVDTNDARETLVRVFARLSDDPLRVYNVYNCLVRSPRDERASAAEASEAGGGSSVASSAAVAETVGASVVLSGSLASVALPSDCSTPVVELTRPLRYLPPAAHQVALAAAEPTQDDSTHRSSGAVLTLRLVDSGKYEAAVFAMQSDGDSSSFNLSVVTRLSITSPGLNDDEDGGGSNGNLTEDAAVAPGDGDAERDNEELPTADDDEEEAACEIAEMSAETDEDAAKAAAHAKKLAARKVLRDALADRHLAGIQSALADYLACGGDPAEKLVKAAGRVETILLAADALQTAIEANTAKLLHDALTQARAANSRGELTAAMKVAERKLAQLQLAEQLSNTVMSLDLRTMSEMRAYAHPPEAVFLVAKATLLLLGTDSADIQDWRQVQAWLGKTGAESVKRRVVMFSYRTTPLERTSLPKRIYERFTPAEVRAVSAGASAFFTWGSGMISLIEQVAAELQEKKIMASAAAGASATPNV